MFDKKLGSENRLQSIDFKENPQSNARIDEYIKNNPEFWLHLQSMPPSYMARALVLGQIEKEERIEEMHEAIKKKLKQTPEMERVIENLVKNLPVEAYERAMLSILCFLR